MALSSKYLFIASMDVAAGHEAAFNDIYDREHVPYLGEVPGVISIARFEKQDFTLMIGGERKTVKLENEPKYTAIYELESPEVLASDAWSKAVEKGRWPAQVRPYTKNRRHIVLKLIPPKP